tara:strand:+ start:47269 stop:47499 length:231 start_codon:yes stop_codon:yes gene_type:complete
MTYRIVITRNGDYVAGQANRLDNLVKSFKLDDEEEFLECVGEMQSLSDYSLQEIFYASEHEKETFNLTKYLSNKGD